jgi:hypothetical protein
MIGLIPRPLHAVLDYLWGVAFTFAPEAGGFEKNEVANAYSKARGLSMIGISMLTRYELGVIRIIPFNGHLVSDFAGALFGFAAPWLLGFHRDEKARNASLGFSAFELMAVLLSKRDRK